ncbi:MAG: thiamine biosynthesis protein ThiS [Planctomycetota bacterium]
MRIRATKNSMKIQLNGKAKEVPEGSTIALLVELLELQPEQVAVELNEQLVRRVERVNVQLCEADRVEMVTLVGGG